MQKFNEKLTIKVFAGIENISLNISQITALIGPQASGKSVTAKLLYFFRGIWQTLYFTNDSELSIDAQKNAVKAQFKKYFPPDTWGRHVFTIQYEFGAHKILLRRAPSSGKPSDGLILYMPDFCEILLKKLKDYSDEPITKSRHRSLGARRYDAWKRIEAELTSELGENYYPSQLFIPAGRAFFSNIEKNVFSFISRSEKRLDPFLAEFGEYFSWVRQGGIGRSAKKEYSSLLAESLLEGSYVIEGEKEFVKTSDGRELPLSNLSSGQQEALPLLMMLEEFDRGLGFLANGENETHVSYIEEPEAHLFPDFQRKITEKIVEYVFSSAIRREAFITTHSPYVLSAMNVMLLAGRLGQSMDKSAQKRIISLVPVSRWIPPGTASVYCFSKDGCRSIIDVESGLIEADYLDSASTAIANTFDSLLAIEFPGAEVVVR